MCHFLRGPQGGKGGFSVWKGTYRRGKSKDSLPSLSGSCVGVMREPQMAARARRGGCSVGVTSTWKSQ